MKNCDFGLENAALVHSFSLYGPPSRQITYIYFHCDWTKFDKLSREINSRSAPWIKNSKTWRFWFIYSDVLFKNLTSKKCVLVSEFTSVKHRMCKIGSTSAWTDFSSLSRLRWSTSADSLLFWDEGHWVSSRVGFHRLSFRRREWC